MPALVLDLSDYQADSIAAAAGIAGVIVKITEAMSGQGATHASAKVAAARACGYPVAGYHFARPGDPAAQAAWATRIAQRLGITTIYCDCEIQGVSATFADAFCASVEGFGLRAGVYVSPGFAHVWGAAPESLATRPLWVADYIDQTSSHPWPTVAPWPAATGWQFTDCYATGGARVDASVFDPEELAHWTGDIVTAEQANQLQFVYQFLAALDGQITSSPTATVADKLLALLTKAAANSTGGVDLDALADAVVARVAAKLAA